MYNEYNSALVRYLNEFFSASSNVTFEEMKRTFSEDLGVDVQREGELYLFKYDMITVKWNDVTRECRGVILTNDGVNGSWRFVSRPPDKFYNLREGHCPFSSEKMFKDNIDQIELVQKADGSAIQMYFWKGEWKVSTLGKITPVFINDYNFTFAELFWNLFKGDITAAVEGVTYFHELCTTYNAIVTQYETDRLYFLLGRDCNTGEMLTQDECDQIAVKFNEFRPTRFNVRELGIETLEGLEEFTEFQSTNSEFGKNPEGFVLYYNGTPQGKLKSNRYLALHRVMTGSKGYTFNSLTELFFNGAIDDFYSDLTPAQQSYIDSLKAYLRELNVEVNEFFDTFDRTISRKDFAKIVMTDSKKKPFGHYFFGRHDAILAGTEETGIIEWFMSGPSNGTKQWAKFDETWKSLFKL